MPRRSWISGLSPPSTALAEQLGPRLPAGMRTALLRRATKWGLRSTSASVADPGKLPTPTKLRPDAQTSAREAIGQLRRLAAAGDLAGATAYGQAALQLHPQHAGLARALRAVATKAGALTAAQQACTVLASNRENATDVRARKLLEGQLAVTAPGYLPQVPEQPVSGHPRRVLHLLKVSMPQRQSGYAVRSMYTLAGQRELGWNPIGVTALDFPHSIGVSDAPSAELVQGVPHVRMLREQVLPADEAAYAQASAEAFARVVQQYRPSVIHAHSGHRGYDTAQVALAVGRASHLPVIYEVRGFFEGVWTPLSALAEQSERYARRYATEAECMRAADAVITLSESMRADILARGVDPSKVHVVPNAVEAEAFAPRARRPELVERLGLAGRFVFGYVSNLDHPREGHELLIEAAAKLRDQRIPATVLIVGDGTRRTELEALTQRLGAGVQVRFTGKVPHAEVADYYALFDLFVIPRINERAARLVTPLKPFEAMAAGIPLAVSDLPALTEIIGGGERGLSFPVGDAAALAALVADVRANPTQPRLLAQAAREWVCTERSWANNAQRYARLYEQVLS